MKKRIAILGSTGSIGTQTLEVISEQPEHFEAEVLTAQNHWELLVQQAIRYNPNAVVIGNEAYYKNVSEALKPHDIKVFAGSKALNEVVEMHTVDMVLTAIVGSAGLLPTIHAIKANKPIALANKETLVVAGELISTLTLEHEVPVLPVDSEHSAIFQCLCGEYTNPIEKLILTSSGGPFRGKKIAELQHITKREALKHPTWTMGQKITIDSATLMNKGLEVIEAKWLFDVNFDQIEVVVHPQSIIHSAVQFTDGSIKAQLGLPDMKLPIQYAMAYPERLSTHYPRFDFAQIGQLTFEKPDVSTFRNLQLAYDAGRKGGNAPCVLNAANEIAVQAFLQDKIGFLQMSNLIENCLKSIPFEKNITLEILTETDIETRKFAEKQLK
ncbi:MAG: 1-deoxy-D-xylulose-5-phosphate reductoisomerase [Bacteroidales bacterium]|nr:1-deoxy-D-xylulose-5-phosphate reductoisomerase [Bacteroidales bacterium]